VARSAKTKTDKTDPPAMSDDAVPHAPEPEPPQDIPAPEDALTDLTQELPSELTPEPELTVDRLPDPEPNAIPQAAPQPVSAPPAASIPKVMIQKVGFAPVVLGGIVAALLGYAAAYFGQQGRNDDLTTTLAAHTDRIAALEAQIAALPATPNMTPLTATLNEMQLQVDAAQADLAVGFGTLDGRLNALEQAPNADGTLSDTAIAAWQRELDGLRTEIEAQQARMQELADAATIQLDQTRVEAATIEQNATDAAAAATARAAVSQVQAALDTGAPFDAALGDLGSGIAVPEALSAIAADGVPTLTALQADFPDAARAALAIARSEGLAGEDGGGISGFLRNQFDIRSVTPQEGAAADAILSRAEDALRQNHLSDAMAEVATLPEVVRAEMAGWTSAAETRAAALAAVEGLSQSLTQN
jgi:hypothetical protein